MLSVLDLLAIGIAPMPDGILAYQRLSDRYGQAL